MGRTLGDVTGIKGKWEDVKVKKSKRKHLITVNFPWGVCNQSCSYCAIGMHGKEMWELPYSLEQIRKAFSNKRLSGSCFINICSD